VFFFLILNYLKHKKNFSNLLINLFYYTSLISESLEKNKENNNLISFSENIWTFKLSEDIIYNSKLTYYVI